MPYPITRDYIDKGNSRSGTSINKVRFVVSHDTGNPGSTAYGNRNYFDRQQPSSSAHTFIDDKYILEIIPLSEKAYHVRANVTADNRLFGVNANDAAIGVELCHGGKINFNEAYKRYVWYHAYLCNKFSLNPLKDIVAHSTLDPSRRSDPINALKARGITWSEFIKDVNDAYRDNFNQNHKERPTEVKGTRVTLPLREGDEGVFVKEVQQDLMKAGFSLPKYGADGHFGDETENAVMRFQKKYGLNVDGLVGQHTLNKLREIINAERPVSAFPLPSGVWKVGDEGNQVKQIQRALKHLNFDPKGIDGKYGTDTANAVKRFQSMYGALKDDGIYGPNTMKYMRADLSN